MDMARNEVRKLAADDYSTVQHLAHASQQARERSYQDFLIVDVDAHHYESESYKEVFEYIENPVIRRQAVESCKRGGRASMLGGTIGYQDIGGRITRHELRRHDLRRHDKLAAARHRDVGMTLEWMDAMGVDYSCMFPTPMLFLGLHPQVEVEVAMCRAYNRWLCERILAAEPRIISMLYLPFNDPDAAYKTVKDFADKKGVVGFMVTWPRDRSVLEATFKMINAETQLMWSSDYPHWDFDLPSVIYDLPFLSEAGRRNILGGTAAKVFGLDSKPVKKIP